MKKSALLILLATVLSSCSVIMAARKDGVSVTKIQHCTTRGQLLSSGVSIVTSESLSEGGLVEVYQVQKERGSAARAFMHGFLDVSTCGLWEVVGTPIEATLDQKEYYSLRVTYDHNEYVKRIELL